MILLAPRAEAVREQFIFGLQDDTCRQELLVDENIDLDIAYLKAAQKSKKGHLVDQ